MTFELRHLHYVLIGLLISQSHARGDSQQTMHRGDERIKRGTVSIFGRGAVTNDPKTNVYQQMPQKIFGLENGNPERETRTMGYGHIFVGKRAEDGSGPSSSPDDVEFSHLQYNQIESQFSPGYFQEFLRKRDQHSDISDAVSAHFDELAHLNKNDLGLLRLTSPQLSNNFNGKSTRLNVEKGNLWKRIPLELFSRTPHYTHSFVGKRSADWESNSTRASEDVTDRNSYDSFHVLNGKRSAGNHPRYIQSFSSQDTVSRFDPVLNKQASPSLTDISIGRRSDHSITKRAVINEKDAALFAQARSGGGDDIVKASLAGDKLKDLDNFDSFDDFRDKTNLELDQDISASSGEDPEKKQPSLSPFSSSFREKRPKFGHSFVGKRYTGFGHKFVGKRPIFEHSFVGKRPGFGHTFIGKRPQFGHSFVGKRPKFGHSFIGKRPKFGHSFIGKRPKFGHSFVGKRPNFGHSFVGKRPNYAHSFVGKRPNFGHNFIGKRSSGFGHRFVGKRFGAFESNMLNKQSDDDRYIIPTESNDLNKDQADIPWRLTVKQTNCCHGFNGKQISNVDNNQLQKRVRSFGHSFVGKRDSTDIEGIDDRLDGSSDVDLQQKLMQ